MTDTPPLPGAPPGDSGDTAPFEELDGSKYTEGSDRYVNFGQDFLQLRYAESQKRILRSIADHQRTIVMSGNGPGKSFAVASGLNGFLFTNIDSVVLGTSGSYSQFVDTMWNPAEAMFETARDEFGLPGDSLGGQQPKLRLDTEWYAKVVSPRKPSELEGRHAEGVLVIIEEADKPYITAEHFDSAGSSITDTNDRMIAIANPPDDETNVVVDKMDSDRWHAIQFSSWESHNVQCDLGHLADETIPGLIDLVTIADDWEEWNDRPWPGIEDAYPTNDYPGMARLKQEYMDGDLAEDQLLSWLRPGFPEVAATVREEDGRLVAARDNLDERWYKRRAGVIPPASATVLRPWSVVDVEGAASATPDARTSVPLAVAYDVARAGGDWNVVSALFPDELRQFDRWRGVDHTENEETAMDVVWDWRAQSPPFAIDAQGEGSGVADRIATRYDAVERFDAGSEAVDGQRFYDCWAEGLYHLGQFLKNGGSIANARLREELLAAARTVEYEERYYKSRDATVWKATPKDRIKDSLGRSPDCLDAAMMCCWAAHAEPSSTGEGFIVSR